MYTEILFATAISAIDIMFSAVFSRVIGPVFPAISFIPPIITTLFGFKLTTSDVNLTSICGVV